MNPCTTLFRIARWRCEAGSHRSFVEELCADLLVIGSGLAGIVSALEAEKCGLTVLILGKFAIGMGTNTSLGSVFTAANSRFSKENHLRATLESGKGLNRIALVKALVENGPDAIHTLKGYGVPMVERRLGYGIDRPEGSSQLAGVLMVRALVKRLDESSIKLVPGLTVFDLLVERGEVQGAFGFLRNGRPCLIRSGAVILATGGAGAIYGRNDNQRSILGDGYALALRAGLPIFDLEFVQFYPLVLAEPRLSSFILLPPYPTEARLFNEKREDLLETLGVRKTLNHAIMAERDRLSLFLYEASQKGDVYFDLTQVPEARWDRYPLNFLKKSKFSFRERPFLVSPAVHFFMGGVEINERGMTAMPGLFAAGEVAWGVHGANRHGGNALTECAVFGILAGQSAVEYVRQKAGNQGQQAIPSNVLNKKWERKARAYTQRRRGAFDRPRDLLKNLKDLAWRYGGPVREEGSLTHGLDRLGSVEKSIGKVYPATVEDLFRKRDLENAALLVRAILQGSLLRKESRGSFYRKDFPHPDDQKELKHTYYRLEKGELKIKHQPIQGRGT